MRHILLITIAVVCTVLGITTAGAQTLSQPNGQMSSIDSGINESSAGTNNAATNNVGADPLTVPTSSMPSGPSASGSASGSANGAITTGSANGSTAGISAPASNNPQAPLLLPGEKPDTSNQSAITTATAPSHASTICPPPVPTSDGGSANLSRMVGESLSGC